MENIFFSTNTTQIELYTNHKFFFFFDKTKFFNLIYNR